MMKKWIGFILTGILLILGFRRLSKTMRDLNSNRYPQFVYVPVEPHKLGVPVFTYHSIGSQDTPDSISLSDFENHLQYLSENGYRTLDSDEFYKYLTLGSAIPPKSVVLTFDDGRATLWTVAFPLLQKYNLKAVSFLNPNMMSESGIRPNLNDFETKGRVPLAELLRADLSGIPAITWEEAKLMHDSGLVDFQSHTLSHTLVFCSPEIIDFISPYFQFGYQNCDVPVLHCKGADLANHKPAMGTPIYCNQPRLGGARRFFDDEDLRDTCVNYVEMHGGIDFFARPGWKPELFALVKTYKREHKLNERFETESEQIEAMQHSLLHSKREIEEHLPGKAVRHLCFPWHRYCISALCLAKQAGYLSVFGDINSQKRYPDWNSPYRVQRVLPTNEFGDDPYQITRIDARDNMILSLPGEKRISYTERFMSRFLKTPALFGS